MSDLAVASCILLLVITEPIACVGQFSRLHANVFLGSLDSSMTCVCCCAALRRERDDEDDAQSSFSLNTTAATAGHSPASSIALSEMSTTTTGASANFDEAASAPVDAVGGEEASQGVVHLRNIRDGFLRQGDVPRLSHSGESQTPPPPLSHAPPLSHGPPSALDGQARLGESAKTSSAQSTPVASAPSRTASQHGEKAKPSPFLAKKNPDLLDGALKCLCVMGNHYLVRPFLFQLLSHQ